MAHRSKSLICLAIAGPILTLAVETRASSDPPDSMVNPVTGFIETVDSVFQGSGYDVRHVTDRGRSSAGWAFLVTDDPHDDRAPRLEIEPSGETWVVWWRDAATDGVLFRRFSISPREWSPERALSRPDESSRNPAVVQDGAELWVAYEIQAASGTGIAVVGLQEDPDPFGRIVLATTDYGGEIDVAVHAENGHLWVTWVDSATEVAWSEYDHGSGAWGLPGHESYVGDTVDGAVDRIRGRMQ